MPLAKRVATMDTMEDFRVPKHRIPAEVVMPDGEARRISLFVAAMLPTHGVERPSDLLNAGDDFVPAVDEASGSMTFLNRAAIVLVRVDRTFEGDDADAVTLPTEHEVEVLLRSGRRLRGLVSYLRPAGHSRLIDFLNEPPRFFRLMEDGVIALVNKRHVSRVALVNS